MIAATIYVLMIYLLNLIPPEYGYRAGVWTRQMLADHAVCAALLIAAFIAGVWCACAGLRG